MLHYHTHGKKLRNNCSPSSSLDTEIENEYHYRVKNGIENDSEQCQPHSFLRTSGRTHKSIESEISKALQEYQKIGTQTLPKDIEELLNPSKFFDDEDNNPWGQQKVPRWNPSDMTWEDRVGKPKKPYFVQKPTSKPEESSEGRDLTWKVPDEYDPNQELDEEQTHFEREQYFESCKPGTKVTMSYGRTAVKNEDGSWTVTTPRRQEGYNPGRDEYDDYHPESPEPEDGNKHSFAYPERDDNNNDNIFERPRKMRIGREDEE